MRLLHKYKIYTKIKYPLSYPTRILDFKRTKWLPLKQVILKKQTKRKYKIRFQNNKITKKRLGHWINLRYTYKNMISNSCNLLATFNLDKRRRKYFNCQVIDKKKDKEFQKFYDHLLNIEQLLFFNRYFSSIFAAKEQIKSGTVLVNNKRLKSSIKLKKGDIILLKDTSYIYRDVYSKQSKTYRFNNSYLESDVYLQSLVILKSKEDITFEDYSIIMGS